MKVLWVVAEDGEGVADRRRALENLGEFSFETAEGGAAGLRALAASSYDAVLAEFPLAEWPPEEWLEEAQRAGSGAPVVIRHREPSVDDAVRLVKLGAYYFFGPDADWARVARILEDARDYRLSREPGVDAEREPWRRLLVGESRPIARIAHIVRLVAERRSTVLITGETGTGKEVVARAIHAASPRAHLPMVAVNCNALPAGLLEAELFGHVKGAFTGAVNNRIGRFEQAHRSTLFLDEIGDMPLDLQGKLLRVLQEREFQRLGSSETIPLDARVIAASNRDLTECIRQGAFREDLYYRLNVVPVEMPPLRDRPADIPLLVRHFIARFCREEGMPPKRIAREAMDRLCAYSWPGNVRQLENAVEMAIALSGSAEELHAADFPLPAPARWKTVALETVIRLPEDGLDFERTVSGIERNILGQALERTRGNKKAAADMLRLKRTTLAAKLKSLEMAT
jgi:DNA-binding NtrC family response regulator